MTWRTQSACLGLDVNDFYPPEDQPGVTLVASATCASCPVTEQCLAEGLESPEPFGIWGGQRLDQPTLAPTTTDTAAHQIGNYLADNPDQQFAARVISSHLGISIQATRKGLAQLVNDDTIQHHPHPNPRPDLYQHSTTPTSSPDRHRPPRPARRRRQRHCAGQLTLDLEYA